MLMSGDVTPLLTLKLLPLGSNTYLDTSVGIDCNFFCGRDIVISFESTIIPRILSPELVLSLTFSDL